MKYFDRVKINIETVGTGEVTFGSASSDAFLTPAEAGALDGDQTPYVIMDGSNFETGVMTIGGSVTVGARAVSQSKIGGTVGVTPLTLSGTAVLAFTARGLDFAGMATAADLGALLSSLGTGALLDLADKEAAEAGVADDLLMTPARTRDAVDLTFALLQMQAADSAALPMFWGNRFADSFKTLTYVDTAGATNLDSSVAGVLKPTVTPGAAQIPTMTGATTGGVTISANEEQSGFNAWKAADGSQPNSTNSDWGSVNAPSGGAPKWLSVDYGAGNSIVVASYEVGASGWSTNSSQNYMARDWTLEGSNDGASWTVLDTRTNVPAWGAAENRTYQIASPGSYRYYLLSVTATQNGQLVILGKIQLYVPGTRDNLTVASKTLPAAVSPASAKLVAQFKPVDGITLGADLMFDVSRDDGTTWTQVAMTDRFISPSPVSGLHVLEGDADLSGQPVGSDMKWRVRSANAKAFELSGVALSS